jgi:hypothetical protein
MQNTSLKNTSKSFLDEFSFPDYYLSMITLSPIENGKVRIWKVKKPFNPRYPFALEIGYHFGARDPNKPLEYFIYGHGWQKVKAKDLTLVEEFDRLNLWEADIMELARLAQTYGYYVLPCMDNSVGLTGRYAVAANIRYSRAFRDEYMSYFKHEPHNIPGSYDELTGLLSIFGMWYFDLPKFETWLQKFMGMKENESMEHFLKKKIGVGFAERFKRNLVNSI